MKKYGQKKLIKRLTIGYIAAVVVVSALYVGYVLFEKTLQKVT